MLPYDKRAAVIHNSAELGEVALAVWPLSEPRQTPVGEAWDFSGEAEIESAPLLVGKENRRLAVIGGDTFAVLAAVRHDYLPHVELRLRQIRGG